MRILMAMEWNPYSIGGVQRHVRELSETFLKKGHEVVVIFKGCSNSREALCCLQHVPIDPILPFNLVVLPPDIRSLKSVISKFSPDIVHVHHAFAPTSILTIHISNKLGFPVILTNHTYIGGFTSPIFSVFPSKLLFFLRSILSRADHIISVSRSAHLFIKNIVGSNFNGSIIPNGVNVERFSFSPYFPENPILLFVGRLVYRKGVHILLKAFSNVVKRFPNAKLLIVGDGYLSLPLQLMAKKILPNDNFTFLGQVSDEELTRIYQSVSLVIVPSIMSESFGMVALEAMASGRPVVASSVGGLSEIVIDGVTGFLVDPADPVMLSNRISTLLEDYSLLKRMGFNARRLVEEKYSWNIIYNMVLKVYRDVLNLHRC